MSIIKLPNRLTYAKPSTQDDAPEEVETFDFDGPVEDDFLLISPSKPVVEQEEVPVPKVTGVYETYCQVKQMMEDELTLLRGDHNSAQ